MAAFIKSKYMCHKKGGLLFWPVKYIKICLAGGFVSSSSQSLWQVTVCILQVKEMFKVHKSNKMGSPLIKKVLHRATRVKNKLHRMSV